MYTIYKKNYKKFKKWKQPHTAQYHETNHNTLKTTLVEVVA